MKLVLADDNLLVREGLATLLRAAGHDVVAAVDGPERVAALVRQHRPDVVIVDIRMPPSFTDEGLRLATSLRSAHPEVGILVLSQFVVGAYAAGLLERSPVRVGYLLKESILRSEVLEDAMTRITRGGTVVDPAVAETLVRASATRLGLTARELEVLRLMAEGLSDKGIADRLTVSTHTVATHVQHIFGKLDLPGGARDNRRVQAVVTYLTRGRRPEGRGRA